jgi:hypothetical protein
MQRTIYILLFFAFVACAQEFKEGGRFSPYGPVSDEINEIIRRAEKEPEALNELAHRPLEETYEAFKIIRGFRSVVGAEHGKQLSLMSYEILFNHPDFENFMQRTLRKMVQLDSLQPKLPLTADGELDFEAFLKMPPSPIITGGEKMDWNWQKKRLIDLFGTIYNHPSAEMRIRLLGPCLELRDYLIDYGDVIDISPANRAAEQLVMAIYIVTGERFPYRKNGSLDVNALREWWKRNEAKYRWTPLPKRVLLNSKSTGEAEKNDKPAGADAAAANQSSAARYWPLFLVAGLFVLLAIGIFLSARSHGSKG